RLESTGAGYRWLRPDPPGTRRGIASSFRARCGSAACRTFSCPSAYHRSCLLPPPAAGLAGRAPPPPASKTPHVRLDNRVAAPPATAEDVPVATLAPAESVYVHRRCAVGW